MRIMEQPSFVQLDMIMGELARMLTQFRYPFIARVSSSRINMQPKSRYAACKLCENFREGHLQRRNAKRRVYGYMRKIYVA